MGVLVGGIGVGVGVGGIGVGVGVGGIGVGVGVGGIGVGVAVAGIGVAVAGIGVAVAGIGVGVFVDVGAGVEVGTAVGIPIIEIHCDTLHRPIDSTLILVVPIGIPLIFLGKLETKTLVYPDNETQLVQLLSVQAYNFTDVISSPTVPKFTVDVLVGVGVGVLVTSYATNEAVPPEKSQQ